MNKLECFKCKKELRVGVSSYCSSCRRDYGKEYAKKHARPELSPEKQSYVNMKNRCTNEKGNSYPSYGGRGIEICSKWLESFDNFLEDMGPRPEGTSLDRIDNDGDYTPENCRWASRSIQSSNRGVHNNNKLGLKNISKVQNQYRVKIKRNGIQYSEFFYDLNDAIKARDTQLEKIK